MDIQVIGKHMTVTPGMKDHLEEKLTKFEKYAPRLVESQVVLKKEKYLFVAEITLIGKNLRLYGEASAKDNIFAAMDEAYTRVEKQLKRFREKVKDHHKNSTPNRKALPETVDTDDREQGPDIVKVRSMVAAKPMFPEDASLQLQNSSKPFLVFQNASTRKVNVLFKREDGNHGLVEPEF
jgi:putative sigma-54 modulation protein